MRQLLAPVDTADQPILDRARAIYEQELSGDISGSVLRDLNSRRGIDIATAVLYVHFESKLLASADDLTVQPADQGPLMVAVAPGAFYKEHPEVGADGRELMELSTQQSWDCELINSESLGTLTANAEIINTFLDRASRSHRVILVSLSKGTADAALARTLRPDLFETLAGWVSVSGVNHGTMMADWLLDKWYLRPVLKFMMWRHGADQQSVSSLRYNPTPAFGMAFDETKFPIVHIAGFPLRQHLSCRRARLWHRRFRTHGPNDSVVLLEDLLRLPGTVIPVWGADHYLQGDWNVSESVTLLIRLLNSGAKQSHEDVTVSSSREPHSLMTRV